MKAATLDAQSDPQKHHLRIVDVPQPQAGPGQILLRVRACGVCRTDLHIVDAELPVLRRPLIPGHQIVGDVVGGATPELPAGSRVGVSWVGGVDGTCPYCRRGMENLCDAPTFTGYSVDGGYAEYAVARADFAFPLPPALDDLHAAPLLCAGIIGFRSLRVAGVEPGDNVGLFGFGSSASLTIAVLQAWNCKVMFRPEANRIAGWPLLSGRRGWEARMISRRWRLDRAVTFAPSGAVVVAALSSLRKGGVVAINAIHLDQMPEFDYDKLLWGERQIRSVANMTRADARDFLDLAGKIGR